MKFHKRITGGQYPIRFDVFLGYGNRDLDAVFAKIHKGSKKITYKKLCGVIHDTDIDAAAGWHFGHNGHYIVIISAFNPHIARYYGTFQHELHHCVRAAGRHLAFPQSEAAEEFYAYLTGYVTERVYAGLWR